MGETIEWEEDLQALSEAATPGPWRHVVGDDYWIESDSYPTRPTHSPICDDTGHWCIAIGNRPQDFGEANSKFIATLVNAYRGGRMARAADAEHYMRLATERARVIEGHAVVLAEAVAQARAEGERAGLERAARYHDEWADRNLDTCQNATASRRHRKYASDIRDDCWIPPRPPRNPPAALPPSEDPTHG